MSKDLATKGGSDLKKLDESQKLTMSLYGDFAEDGFEDADGDCYAIPFLQVLQSNSPQCKRSDGKYIEGAQEGMILDTVSQQILDPAEGLRIIQCHFRRAFVEWGPRNTDQAGYKGEHPVDTPLRQQTEKNDKGKDVLPSGNELSDTRYHYVLAEVEPGRWERFVMDMTSTKIKTSKRLMKELERFRMPNGRRMPSFGHVVTMRTIPQQKGENTWFIWDFDRVTDEDEVKDRELVQEAYNFLQAIKSGDVREAIETADAAYADADVIEGETEY